MDIVGWLETEWPINRVGLLEIEWRGDGLG